MIFYPQKIYPVIFIAVFLRMDFLLLLRHCAHGEKYITRSYFYAPTSSLQIYFHCFAVLFCKIQYFDLIV